MHRTFYGTKRDGGAVHAFTLTNANGLAATILDIAALAVAARHLDRGDGAAHVQDGRGEASAAMWCWV